MKFVQFTTVLLALMLVSPKMGYKLETHAVQERGRLCTLDDLERLAGEPVQILGKMMVQSQI